EGGTTDNVEVAVTSSALVQNQVATMAHTRLENPSKQGVTVALTLTVRDAAGATVTVQHDRAVLRPAGTTGVVTLLSVAEKARVS
ncbi:hypothetical protein NL336_27070, partial [Klebsiella pneumoniae]|nr:hypothetical protein [Klebsiella pneumoniae]